MTASNGSSPTLVLRKIRQVLDCFVPDNRLLTLTEIHQMTGIPTTTALRLLRNLVTEGFLARDKPGYRLGPQLVRYAAAVDRGLDLIRAAAPVLQELRDRTGETASLVIRSGLQRITVAVAPSRKALVQQAYVGDTVPLQSGSSSKVLLAYDSAAASQVIANGLVRFTPNTVTDPAAYQAELDGVRRCGYATSDSEVAEMVASVSCPVFDGTGSVVAAVCVGGPAERINYSVRESLVSDVSAAAGRVSAALGWHGGDSTDDEERPA